MFSRGFPLTPLITKFYPEYKILFFKKKTFPQNKHKEPETKKLSQ